MLSISPGPPVLAPTRTSFCAFVGNGATSSFGVSRSLAFLWAVFFMCSLDFGIETAVAT